MKKTINISVKNKKASHSIVKMGGSMGTKQCSFNTLYPWLNTDGSMKSDKEISALGQHWNAETWDNYLKATIEHGDTELLLEESMDDIKALSAKDFFDFITTVENYEYLQGYVQQAMRNNLSPKEESILRMKYFENMSEKEVAEKLSIGLETLKKYRKSALKKIKNFLTTQEAISEIKSLVLFNLIGKEVV